METLKSMEPKPDETVLQFVIFEAGDQHFAVEINRVKEILRYRKVTPLPKAPTFLEGVIDLRGAVIPVVDLRKRFDVAKVRNDSQTRIIVLRWQRKRIGLVVDAVHRVLSIEIKEIKAPPAIAHAHGSHYMLAVARYQDHLYIILDLDRILTTTERVTLEEVKLA
jgi:purine-binding chemotaxis protein CheW